MSSAEWSCSLPAAHCWGPWLCDIRPKPPLRAGQTAWGCRGGLRTGPVRSSYYMSVEAARSSLCPYPQIREISAPSLSMTPFLGIRKFPPSSSQAPAQQWRVAEVRSGQVASCELRVNQPRGSPPAASPFAKVRKTSRRRHTHHPAWMPLVGQLFSRWERQCHAHRLCPASLGQGTDQVVRCSSHGAFPGGQEPGWAVPSWFPGRTQGRSRGHPHFPVKSSADPQHMGIRCYHSSLTSCGLGRVSSTPWASVSSSAKWE